MMPEINPIGKYMTEDMNYNLREFARFTENILKGADLAVYLGISNNPEFSYVDHHLSLAMLTTI